MNQTEFDEVKKTFPWTEQVMLVGPGGLVRLIDVNGNEVPIFKMTKFLELITRKLTVKEAEEGAA